MKKIQYIVCLLLGLSLYTQATSYIYAQNTNTISEGEEVASLIGIEQLTVQQKSADAVSVYPKIFSTFPQDKVERVEISLMHSTSKETENAVEVAKTIVFSDVTIKKGDTSLPPYVVTFSNMPYREDYRIQMTFTNKDGIVDSVKQSEPFAFGDKLFSSFANIQIQKEYIDQSGKESGPQDGPRIAKTGATTSDALYVLKIKNTNAKQEVYVSAKVTYTKFNSERSPEVVDVEGILIKPNTTGTLTVKPMLFSEPGTYVADVVLTYSIDGRTSTQDREFRYMLGDLIINAINFRESDGYIRFDISGANGDTQIPEFTDEDFNIDTSLKEKTLVVETSYLGRFGEELASTTQTISYAVGVQEVVLPLDVQAFKKTYKNMSSISVRIMDGSYVLQEKNTPFSFAPDPILPQTFGVKTYGILCLVLLIVYILIRTHVSQNIRRLLFWLLLAVILCSGYAYYTTVRAESGPNGEGFWISRDLPLSSPNRYWGSPDKDGKTYKKCVEHGYAPIVLSKINHVTIPSPTTHFSCGNTTTISIASTNGTCANSDSYVYFRPSVMTGLSFGGKKPLGVNRLVYKKGTGSIPMNITFDPGFSGTAVLRGLFYNQNGQCNSESRGITYHFDVNTCTVPPVQDVCECSGRSYLCTNPYSGTTTKITSAPQCGLSASCTTSLAGNQGTFTITPHQSLGIVRYYTTNGQATPNPYTTTVALGSTSTRTVRVVDTFDSSYVLKTCTIVNDGSEVVVIATSTSNTSSTTNATSTATTTLPEPIIEAFMSAPNIVKKGQPCNYSWITEGFDSCALVVNKINQPAGGVSSSVKVPTTNGLNQFAILTCRREPIGTSTPEVTMSTTTSCGVNPDIQER